MNGQKSHIHPGAELLIDQCLQEAVSRVSPGMKAGEAKERVAEVMDRLRGELVDSGYVRADWAWNVTTPDGAERARQELIREGWLDHDEALLPRNHQPIHFIVVAIGFDANEQFPERFYSKVVPVPGVVAE